MRMRIFHSFTSESATKHTEKCGAQFPHCERSPKQYGNTSAHVRATIYIVLDIANHFRPNLNAIVSCCCFRWVAIGSWIRSQKNPLNCRTRIPEFTINRNCESDINFVRTFCVSNGITSDLKRWTDVASRFDFFSFSISQLLTQSMDFHSFFPVTRMKWKVFINPCEIARISIRQMTPYSDSDRPRYSAQIDVIVHGIDNYVFLWWNPSRNGGGNGFSMELVFPVNIIRTLLGLYCPPN